jgi:hypothetical protein
MKIIKYLFLMVFFVFLWLVFLSNLGTCNTFEANRIKPGEFVIEPSTLIALGFEWYIKGDDNRNAIVNVSYRKKGTVVWKDALPLLRLNGEQITTAPFNYVVPNKFAGSIFDLEPDTEYECRFIMSDPDGVNGQFRKTVKVRTRAEPQPYKGGRVFHIYPPGFKGQKQEPAFEGLLGTYYTGSAHADWYNSFPPRVQPGDTILVHTGLYKDNRWKYGGGLGTVFTGTYYLTRSGTAEKPIAIKAAGDGEVIFDGDGCYTLFNLEAGNYHYFEGITFRNADIAIQAGEKNIAGSSGLTVKKCRFENVGIGIHTDYSGSKNFYIADNVFIGRHDPNILMGWTGKSWEKFPEYPAPTKSNMAVKVYGQGHVVAYNYVANFHDGIDNATYGVPDGYPREIRDRMPVSIDIYNNDITNVHDNCIEADGAAHNIRILRNRCFNHAHRALSAQTLFGGPAYFIRNIVYNAPEGGSIKLHANPAGVIFYHNTFCAEVDHMRNASSNIHFRNNLILGQGAYPAIFAVDTYTNYTSSDYNGFRPNHGAEYSFSWNSPPLNMITDYSKPREARNFKTLQEYSQATGQDKHSILVDYNIFVNVSAPQGDQRKVYKAIDFDFQLKSSSVAIDAGVVLPNVNDSFTGKAPDLGALESGLPMPVYGPRP